MCVLCDANGGEYEGCQDCGRLICYEAKDGCDDILRPAYVTMSCDLFCDLCGRSHDKVEEEEIDEEMRYEELPDEADSDTIGEDCP